MGKYNGIAPSIVGLYHGLSAVHIRRSALSSFLWACLFISVPCYCIVAFVQSPLCYWVFALGSVPIVVFMIAALFLLFFDRERLHSEEHLERKHAMEIIETKGQGLLISPVDLTNMVNPAPDQEKISPPEEEKLPALPDREELSNG